MFFSWQFARKGPALHAKELEFDRILTAGPSEIQVPETKEKIKTIWNAHPKNVTDPRVIWELKWNRVKKHLQLNRREAKNYTNNRSILAEELNALRSTVGRDSTEEFRKQLAHLEAKVKDLELKEARSWRLISKSRWLREEDAPSHYFFALLKSKFKRKNLESLTTDTGETLTSKEEILAETSRFYQNLFSEESDFEEEIRSNTLREGLGLLKKKLDSVQNRSLEAVPGMEEIERIVNLLPSEKSPGLDGVTSEVIRDLWPWIKEDCRRMIQTGFVPGRSIFDSILAVKLGQEWAETMGQKSIFLKLDFVKAYDRVIHSYLWSVLDTLGFGSHFITLLHGLVENATSVVHINGGFTREINLDRGVRQGCPIAPMLFTLSTQPLMELLRVEQVKGQLQGLEAGNGHQVLEALFADDTGLLLQAEAENWEKATEVINKFEIMSGARLNVSKSLVVPIGFQEPPEWLRRTGCKTTNEGEV
ncbi:hypothetical protein R1sor_006985 [Riccia sorocarpa]|uniref:Reverse transcriptase domain-containing protein n=1 Tax=Riccia sorocarpa TaxID=122646 RepID=A0ABD3HVF9_9MARC